MNKWCWISSIITLGILDVYADRRKKVTLSQTARELFRTNTKPGKVMWVVSWLGLTTWLIPHIWKNEVKQLVEDVLDSDVLDVLEYI
jgi:hypothetical protein